MAPAARPDGGLSVDPPGHFPYYGVTAGNDPLAQEHADETLSDDGSISVAKARDILHLLRPRDEDGTLRYWVDAQNPKTRIVSEFVFELPFIEGTDRKSYAIGKKAVLVLGDDDRPIAVRVSAYQLKPDPRYLESTTPVAKLVCLQCPARARKLRSADRGDFRSHVADKHAVHDDHGDVVVARARLMCVTFIVEQMEPFCRVDALAFRQFFDGPPVCIPKLHEISGAVLLAILSHIRTQVRGHRCTLLTDG
jgi:hypothetical protein